MTLLDLLKRYPACQLEFGDFLGTLTPLSPRQYSISSSPRWREDAATLTVGVLKGQALAGGGIYEGVASTYLARAPRRRPGGARGAALHRRFPPAGVASHPSVMVSAGTGTAPFRGFLQDRAIRAQGESQHPAPALLFFGCRDAKADYRYRDELAAWSERGLIDTRPAVSRGGVLAQYVQDRLGADRADVVELVEADAVSFASAATASGWPPILY